MDMEHSLRFSEDWREDGRKNKSACDRFRQIMQKKEL